MIYKNNEGMFHRVNSPAIEWDGYNYSWWYNGEVHRYYGVARVWGGEENYYIFDEEVI